MSNCDLKTLTQHYILTQLFNPTGRSFIFIFSQVPNKLLCFPSPFLHINGIPKKLLASLVPQNLSARLLKPQHLSSKNLIKNKKYRHNTPWTAPISFSTLACISRRAPASSSISLSLFLISSMFYKTEQKISKQQLANKNSPTTKIILKQELLIKF